MLIDTRGLSCPQPLLMVYPHLSGSEAIDVLVDNATSRENITRAAHKNGWNVTEQAESEDVIRLELRK
ncbi:MAG: sulfurtransferase TusA family protein [Mailhella sp.]|nr:sulfurtransferase TusA family protein [Mailhella sp.]